MELHQLEYVVAVAKFHSFTKAAAEINTTQPLLSQQIKKLESELGIQLFERTTRNVDLTSAGKAFLLHAQKVLGEIEQSKHTVRDYLNAAKGCIKLGVLPALGHYSLTSLIANFQRQFPGVRIELVEGNCGELLSLLAEHKVSAAIISDTETHLSVDRFSLLKDHVVLVTNILHPLAGMQSVSLASLAHEKFVMAHPESDVYGNFITACRNAGFEPDILYHCNQADTQLEFVREGLAVTVLSSKVAARYADNDLAAIALDPEVSQKISLYTMNDGDADAALKVFVKFSLDWVARNKTSTP